MRSPVLYLLIGLLAAAAPIHAADRLADRVPDRLNVLWIIGDDLGPDLGCYGTAAVKTPNLDRLAAQGVRFTRAHTTAPVCSPSRSALITGLYQTTIGAHHHRSHRNDGYTLPDGVRLITDCFRDAGYYTANVETISPDLPGSGKTDFNFQAQRPFDGKEWSQLKSHQPFYAQVNFMEPHRGGSWLAAKKNRPGGRVDPASVILPPYYPDHPLAREDYANYLQAVQALDEKVGMVLKKLEEDGLAQNTVVIFLGDNGRCHVRDKQWCYDGGTHIPLIVRGPGRIEAGGVREDLVSGIDVAATSLDIAGISLPKTMQGQVFLGPRAAPPREYVFTARDRCDETFDRIRCVRGTKFSYIRNFNPELPYTQPNKYKERQYPVLGLMKELNAKGKLTPQQALFMAPRKPAEELYDLDTDPYEVHNLAGSPDHRATLEQMRKVLDAWIDETHDQGAQPEKPGAGES